jgi:glycosyltransferase involved in cell wall biosynthesis
MRILYISPFWPRESTAQGAGFRRGGSQIRSLGVLRALQQMGTVEIVNLNDENTDSNLVLDPGYDANIVRTLEVNPKANRGLRRKFAWAFNPHSNYPNGCSVGDKETREILESLSNYDLVWFFKQRSPDMFPNAAWSCSVLDIDDVPSTCENVNLQVEEGWAERARHYTRRFSWRRREKLFGDRFTVLTVCSEEDRQYLKAMGLEVPIHVIPNGFETPAQPPLRNAAQPPRIGFIGLFNHFPNRDGIRWFAQKCWPRIKREIPDARLRLVGLGSDGRFKPEGSDIDGLGWLADPAEEIRTWSLMVVPMRVGGGTRVKIAHGLSQKCPIVSTSIGAYGYAVRNGHDMYLADSVEDFSTACIRAIRMPEQAAQVAERGWNEFLQKWTWEAIAPSVWAAAEDCLRRDDKKVVTVPGRKVGQAMESIL